MAVIYNIQSNTLCSGFYQKPLMGVLAIFSTGTYVIGAMCVESETCFEKYHEKKDYFPLNVKQMLYLQATMAG